jgi:uncharacterized protein (DUF736 family)
MSAGSKTGDFDMATIGTFTKTSNGYIGTIKTLSLNVEASIQPFNKGNEKTPDFRIYAGTLEIGAGWKKNSAADCEYISCKLDDPIFPSPIYASLIAAGDGKHFSLMWSR